MGVGPWPGPWPVDERYDPVLLADGDRRNVVDRYRYWTVEAIVADLDRRRHPFHVAIENFANDFNIGSVVRTANAFLAAEVHVVGRRRWNRRGAMVTDRYQHVRHHDDVDTLLAWADAAGLPVLGVDNLPGALPLETARFPRACVLLFGQEGAGLLRCRSRRVRGHLVDRAVRLDPFHQRGRRRGDRDARLDPPARRPRPGAHRARRSFHRSRGERAVSEDAAARDGAPADRAGWRDDVRLLGQRDLGLLTASRFVSVLGTGMAPVALAFAVLGLPGGDAGALGIVLFASALPQVLFMLVGGVVADRFRRSRVMVVSESLAGVAQVLTAVIVLSGTATVPALALLAAAGGVAVALFFPALTGIVPEVASDDQLQSANALLRLASNLARILGAAIGGILVATVGAGWALLADGLSFLFSAVLIAFVRTRRRSAASGEGLLGRPSARLAGVHRAPVGRRDRRAVLAGQHRLRRHRRGPRAGPGRGESRRCRTLGGHRHRLLRRHRARRPRRHCG